MWICAKMARAIRLSYFSRLLFLGHFMDFYKKIAKKYKVNKNDYHFYLKLCYTFLATKKCSRIKVIFYTVFLMFKPKKLGL